MIDPVLVDMPFKKCDKSENSQKIWSTFDGENYCWGFNIDQLILSKGGQPEKLKIQFHYLGDIKKSLSKYNLCKGFFEPDTQQSIHVIPKSPYTSDLCSFLFTQIKNHTTDCFEPNKGGVSWRLTTLFLGIGTTSSWVFGFRRVWLIVWLILTACQPV